MEDEPRRRIRRRRAFSGGSVSDSTVAYGSVAHDEVDDAIDPDLEVERMAAQSGTSLQPQELSSLELQSRRPIPESGAYERELRLRLCHSLLMRGEPLHKIADHIGVSIDTVRKYKSDIAARMRESAANMDMNELIGEGMAFYHEVQHMGLQTASKDTVPTNMRLAAMRTSLSARNDMNRFLHAAGVFDVLRFKPKGNAENEDIKQLVQSTKAMLFGEDGDNEEGLQEVSAS